MFYNYDLSKEYLNNFCNYLDIELIEKGSIGFGRPCVGIYKDGCYIGYNSIYYTCNSFYYYFKNDKRFDNYKAYNAYNKVSCFAVLCEDDVFKYRKAIIELANWIYKLDKEFKLSIKKYKSKNMNAKMFFAGSDILYDIVIL